MFITTGVCNANDLESLWDMGSFDFEYAEQHDELFLQYTQEHPDLNSDEIEYMIEKELDCFEAGRQYYGDWKEVGDGYEPDKSGKEGFAAIHNCNVNTIQVVWSTIYMECSRCSPCYPYQGDLNTPGTDYFAYALPLDLMSDEWRKVNENRVITIEGVEGVA